MGEVISWNFELGVIKEYLSKFYSDRYACIREYIANAIAAQHRVGVRDPILVEITPKKIVVEDSGIGITKEKFKEIFMWFGRSEHKDVDGVQGRFGLGAKSFMMLTGDKGYVIMKTRSRETNESYRAVIRSNGAEIRDDLKREKYGTRFEIYLEEPLDPDTVSRFARKTVELFEFSRIPIKLVAHADGAEFVFEFPNGKISRVDRVEVTIGFDENPKVLLRESTDFYEVGTLTDWPYGERSSWYYERRFKDYGKCIVVVGDVKVDTLYDWPRKFVRIKVEDGREIDLGYFKAKAPEPLPNRDGYKNIESFVRALKLKGIIDSIKEEYGDYFREPIERLVNELSVRDAVKLFKRMTAVAKDFGVALESYSSRKVPQTTVNVMEKNIAELEKILPKFMDTYAKLILLLTEWPLYGYGAEVVRERGRLVRTRVTLLEFLQSFNELKNTSIKYGYLQRAPSKVREETLAENTITAIVVNEDVCDLPDGVVYSTKNPLCEVVVDEKGEIVSIHIPERKVVQEVIKILESAGITKISKVKGRTKVKVYSPYNHAPTILLANDLLEEWKWDKLMVFVDRISDYKGYMNTVGLFVQFITAPKTVYKEYKEKLKDFVITGRELKEMIEEMTLVTDGYEVYTLKEVKSDNTQPLLVQATKYELKLLPALRKLLNKEVYAVLTFYNVWHSPTVRDILYASDEIKLTSEDSLNVRAAKQLLGIISETPDDNLCYIFDDLIDILYKYLEIAKPDIDKMFERFENKIEELFSKLGFLEIGDLKMKEVIPSGLLSKDLENASFKGFKWLNPLANILVDNYFYWRNANYTDHLEVSGPDSVTKATLLRIAKSYLGFMAPIIYNAEFNEAVEDRKEALLQLMERWYESYRLAEYELKVLSKLSPTLRPLILLDAI